MFRHLAKSCFVALVVMLASVAPAAADSNAKQTTTALFEGRIIDLQQPWGEATACNVGDDGNTCYRTEAEMDEAIGAIGGDQQRSAVTPLATCASSLRLYDGTFHTGAVLQLSTRLTTIQLSGYSFASRTSSYQIGACSAVFKDGSGTTYPGSTSAGASALTMVSGWDNRITSVFIS